MRRFAEQGHRHTRNLVPEPSVLGWEGGLAGMAEWLGASSKKAETFRLGRVAVVLGDDLVERSREQFGRCHQTLRSPSPEVTVRASSA